MKPASQTAAEALEELQWHHSAGECEASTPIRNPPRLRGKPTEPCSTFSVWSRSGDAVGSEAGAQLGSCRFEFNSASSSIRRAVTRKTSCLHSSARVFIMAARNSARWVLGAVVACAIAAASAGVAAVGAPAAGGGPSPTGVEHRHVCGPAAAGFARCHAVLVVNPDALPHPAKRPPPTTTTVP